MQALLTLNMSNMIASAVVVPEQENVTRQTSPSLKRRQSSLDSETSKRPRLDTQTSQYSNDDARSPTSAMSPPRRKSSAIGNGAAEERKRGQRLFGALLGTLSQTSPKPAHRRRDEIEKRQQEKLRQKDEELAEEKRNAREKLDAVRREEQKAWNEQGMRIRHQSVQATAHFLKTKTEPSLYYRPWDLRPEEEAQIKQQISETEEVVSKELAGKEAETEPKEADVQMEEEQKPGLVGDDITNKQKATATPEPQPTNDVPMNDERPKSEEKGHERRVSNDDHGGEELVEGQEDDVIY